MCTETTALPVFLAKLQTLPDPRDRRGKRHALPFVLAAVTLAILAGRAKVSSIHRYIHNRIDWLRTVTGQPNAQPISRAHLPRLVARVDWEALNALVEDLWGVRLTLTAAGEWTAVDGKTLRGTDAQNERTLLAVTHTGRETVAQQPMTGPKESEITAARDLLRATGLDTGRVTLDALHLNPTTTAQINTAGGVYAIQVKENQAELKAQCETWAAHMPPVATVTEPPTKGHGRVESRRATLFSLTGLPLADRWAESGLQTLVQMERHTTTIATQTTSAETSYYVSNLLVTPETPAHAHSLVNALRGHWGVEANNYIRDVTLREDHVKTRHGNQGHVLACLRTLAMQLLRRAGVKNFQAALENFTDCPQAFEAFLRQTGFL